MHNICCSPTVRSAKIPSVRCQQLIEPRALSAILDISRAFQRKFANTNPYDES